MWVSWPVRDLGSNTVRPGCRHRTKVRVRAGVRGRIRTRAVSCPRIGLGRELRLGLGLTRVKDRAWAEVTVMGRFRAGARMGSV